MTRILNGYAIYGDSEHQNIMQTEIELKQSIDKETMEQAFRAALEQATLINVRLAWKDNCLYFVENHSVFYLSDEDRITLGENNGGFLLSACAHGKKLTIASVHALADGVLLFPFIRLVLMNYLGLLGECIFDKQIAHLASRLSGDMTGEGMLLEKLQEIRISEEKIQKCFRLSALEGGNEQEYKVITLGLDAGKMSTSKISQVAQIIRKQINKLNIDGTPISCSLVYDMRSRLKISEPLHECYSFISIPFEDGEFEDKWKQLEFDGKMSENMARELPIWLKLSSEDMFPESKRRLCNRISRKQEQYQDTFSISNIAFTNKLDRLNNYIESISTCIAVGSRDILLEMNQLGDTICLSVSYIRVAESVVSAFIDEMRQLDILKFEKTVKPIAVSMTLPN